MLAIHPGRVLKRELSVNQRALELSIPRPGGSFDIMNGTRGSSADTTLRLGRYFGNNPQFWMNLQSQYDLVVASNEYGEAIKNEVRMSA